MGLDQYLYAKLYTSNSDNFSSELYSSIVEASGAENFMADYIPSIEVSVKLGQWRKANQIHDWFVRNIQHGEDNCMAHYVSREQLQELQTTCEEVIADHSLAETLLPTSSGFFYGSDEYDDYYFENLAFTLDLISKALTKVPEDWDFSYDSSW